MQELIRFDNHYIIVDDSEISKGDFVYVDCPEIEVKDIREVNDYYNEQYLFKNGGQIHIDYCKKITHSTQPIDDKIKTLSFNGLNDLEFYKKNAEENYLQTPLSVLKYITELEKKSKQNK